ncbi:MAG: DNA-binding domain-containing protein [Pseudoruegeria sp.]
MNVGQSDFTTAILDPELAVPTGLVDPDGRPAGKRFSVYRNNVVVSLTEALGTAFPVIKKLVGDTFFDALAGVYLRRFPPHSPLMMFYGENMPDFLAGFEPVQHLGYLPDIARLELAMRHSYHAADTIAISPERLQDLSPDRLMASTLRFAPAVQLLRSHWPIAGIWTFNMIEGAAQPVQTGENALITRPEYDPTITALPPGGGVFVAALTSGETFGEALDKATAATEAFDLSQTLGILITGAAITDIVEGKNL